MVSRPRRTSQTSMNTTIPAPRRRKRPPRNPQRKRRPLRWRKRPLRRKRRRSLCWLSRSTPVDYARVQAEAILAQARDEAEAIKEAALQQAEDEIRELKRQAQSEGFDAGHADGMAKGMEEGRGEIERQAAELGIVVGEFLDTATKMRDQLLDQTREELRDLALVIAEKVIRVSLRSSGDVLMRMIETATEKHRRCEWVQIYIADCDARNLALSMPELTASLGHLSDRVRIIPMMDDESGTCIIEMPDEIIDASVSTQLENIREIMNTTVSDRE